MALTISATDTELQKPVNVVFQQRLLRNAKALCPYFAGTDPAELQLQGGTATVKWRRIENITPTTTPLAELTGNAAYGQGRDSTAASFTDIVATVAKYGQYYILNEEVNLFNPTGQDMKLAETLAISAGRSLDQLQRNVVEDNATKIYGGNVGSDGAVVTSVSATDLDRAVNELQNQDALTFTPMSMGEDSIGTGPVLPSYWGINHPNVSHDMKKLSGFRSVETYAGQVQTMPGEYGYYSGAGEGLRLLQTTDASVDADAGGTKGSTGLRGTSDVDLYSISVYGQEALGSVGFGLEHTQEIYRAGDDLPAVIALASQAQPSAADPFAEVNTLAWKAWHTGAVINANWSRVIRVGATDLSA
ncbi:MAG: N4-gp56 family major capsid protein [Geminicoccaceae bacterium]